MRVLVIMVEGEGQDRKVVQSTSLTGDVEPRLARAVYERVVQMDSAVSAIISSARAEAEAIDRDFDDKKEEQKESNRRKRSDGHRMEAQG